ncbi:hypothetical protein EAH80_11725 [Mycobacterium hodleri]|uniref:Uncharacterized protein n=1 Tax=Mycolicibacterium hodleri TaxID=49897 RepID=A0A502E9E4_9MYCO|nr:hypothetical protein EAH80_11725 [Mycolicibacterium hodleri]
MPGYRRIAAHCGVDRKTVRRYVEAAQTVRLGRGNDVSAADDGLIGARWPRRCDTVTRAGTLQVGAMKRISAYLGGFDEVGRVGPFVGV